MKKTQSFPVERPAAAKQDARPKPPVLGWVVAFAAGSALALAVAWTVGGERPREARIDPASTQAEVEKLRQSLERLEREQRQQRTMTQAALALKETPEAQADASDTDALDTAAREAAAPARPTSAEMYEGLESTFHGQGVDGNWAGDAESQLWTAVGKFPRTRVTTVQCKTDMCRLEAHFEKTDDREEFEDGFMKADAIIGKHVWSQRFKGEGEESRSVFLVSREGPLPIAGMAAGER